MIRRAIASSQPNELRIVVARASACSVQESACLSSTTCRTMKFASRPLKGNVRRQVVHFFEEL